jgi:uroporphyrinogen-III synthase
MTRPPRGAAGAAPLAGLNILVTRPAHQAGSLAELIREAGGSPVLFPVLEIVDTEHLEPLYGIIERLEAFDLAIFISPNAVDKAMNLIGARRGTTRLPAGLAVAAVGKGSRKALERFGIEDVLAPESRFDSEGLLDLPQLRDMGGKQVVIFRGEGGRELLGDELTRRGAVVEYAECYRRGKPNVDAAPLLHLWARDELAAITVTSGEGLRNLYDLVGKLGRQWLKRTPLFVPHERIASVARELGLEEVWVTGPGDAGMLDGLLAWRTTMKDGHEH